MSYSREREDFIARVTREGLPLDVARLLLREATGLNRRAELACSSEAADRDRVPCPGERGDGYPCLCDDWPAGTHAAGKHAQITRITLQDWQSEQRITKALADLNLAICKRENPDDRICVVDQWRFCTQGDPRGYVLRVIPPSYAQRNVGRDRFNLDAIGVPSGPSGLRF